MRTIILGDPHVGKGNSISKPGIGNALGGRVQDQVHLLDFVLNTAISNCVLNIIITGDIFEINKPEPSLILVFIDWLKRCAAHDIDVHILLGNHDMLRSGTSVQSALDIIANAELPNAHVYKSIETIHFDDVSFTLVPFKDRRSMGLNTFVEVFEILKSQLCYEAALIPNQNIKILVGHLAVEGAIPIGDEFDNLANEIHCPLSLFNDYDYVWMGHVHKFQTFNEKPYIAHIGSMDLSDFGEVGEQKYIILFDSELTNPIKEIKLPTRPLRAMRVACGHDQDITESVIQAINKENAKQPLTDAIVRLEVKLPSRDSEKVNREVVEKLIYELGAHHICNFSESPGIVVVPNIQQGELDETMDVMTAVGVWASRLNIDEEVRQELIKEAKEVFDIYEASLK